MLEYLQDYHKIYKYHPMKNWGYYITGITWAAVLTAIPLLRMLGYTLLGIILLAFSVSYAKYYVDVIGLDKKWANYPLENLNPPEN